MEKSRAVRGRKKYFPLYVDLSEKKVLVAGSGPAALRALGAAGIDTAGGRKES